MRCSATALVLATLAIGQAIAGPYKHQHHAHIHQKKSPHPLEVNSNASESKRDDAATYSTLTAADAAKLSSIGCMTGTNSLTGGSAWLGGGGPYTSVFINSAAEDIILVVWGPDASWVNSQAPLITVSLPSGGAQTVSFASGLSGAWSAIYPDTDMVNGQISNTWGEFTWSLYGVFDISREVNMGGHDMEIVGSECTSTMDTCVFMCTSGNTCMTDYVLQNCGTGSQPGAQFGTYGGFDSGGCGGLGNSATVTTTFA